ncbi:MAG: MerR family transcriptional regulator [Massilibacteroides sp.]|nr:MerR family transcriptional regulator [Massilibacteroides sp.]
MRLRQKQKKLFYSIKEVASRFDINESTLRYWETEFNNIHPRKNGKGARYYTQDDIKEVELVHHLLKEKGLTLVGARKRIKDNKEGSNQRLEVIRRLQAIKQQLLEIKSQLDQVETSQTDLRSNQKLR